jgi:hypothetical protein
MFIYEYNIFTLISNEEHVKHFESSLLSPFFWLSILLTYKNS